MKKFLKGMKKMNQVTGTIDNIIYENTDNNYIIFEIIGDEDQNFDDLICVGFMPKALTGEYVILKGKMVDHSTYGPQFAFDSFEKKAPSSEYGIEKYLASGIIRGIGPKTAKTIVNKFGDKTLEVIEKEHRSLADIKGITLKKANSIHKVFMEEIEARDILIFLQSFDISPVYSNKIYKKYKKETIEIIKKNPYVLADDVEGISFKTADVIAQKMGIDQNSPFRIKACIKFCITASTYEGNTYIPENSLYNEVIKYTNISHEEYENYLIDMQLNSILTRKKIDETVVVYLNTYFYSENYIAKKLLDLSLITRNEQENIDLKIKKFEKEKNITLAKEQVDAIIEALSQGVLVITGGPGTGKTTIINCIIHILEKENYDVQILLAAPTGRAAKRMEQATSHEASTIHRLLEINFNQDASKQYFEKNEENPLEADVVILDESSMIDTLLFSNFLKAINMGTRLILVGDVDQLPSVGAGNVLKDIINSKKIPVVKLKEIFRQGLESKIVTNAHKINKGEYPNFNEEKSDFLHVERSYIETIITTTIELVQTKLPKYMNCKPIDIQVLTPMRKNPLGSINLNNKLQEVLNPYNKNKKEKEYRNTIFRVGDKVMQIKNNYSVTWTSYDKDLNQYDAGTGIYNGDEGIIMDINENDDYLVVFFDDNKRIEYSFKQLDELELAYAITIHKSQGSEYKTVVLPIFQGPNMLFTRNLLYTAITRGKELVCTVGQKSRINFMVDNKRERDRYSSLDLYLETIGALYDDKTNNN